MTRLFSFALVCALVAACGTSSKPEVNNGSPNNVTANNVMANNTTAPNNVMANNTNPNNTTGPNNTNPNNTTGPNNTIGPNNTTGPGGLTWHKDTRAIVEQRCQQCHYAGGIGPFTLLSYADVQPLTALIASAVSNDIMPPWPPADGCGDFQDERRLDPMEKSALLDWIAAGAPEGDPADYVAPMVDTVNLGTPDFTTDIGLDYVPSPPGNSIDDYHCFIIEHGLGQDQFMNAFQVRPGNIASVHHVLFWQVDNSGLAGARAKEATPGAGYTCFGGNGSDSASELGLIGGWVPGALPLEFAPGHGFKIPSNSFLIVQVHYNTINSSAADRTAIDMWFTDGQASTELAMYPLADSGINIPAGRVDDTSNENDARGEFSFTLPIGAPIYGVVPHMHTLGSRIKVSAGNQCLVDIPEWDFNWQGFYLFKTPVMASAGSQLTLNCWYDNSAANQQAGRTPADVSWGDGTYDEMCLAYLITRSFF